MADLAASAVAPVDGATEVCRNYRNTGRCRFAENCKFEHSDGDPIPLPERVIKARGVCFNFRDGECKFGDSCRFFHGDEAGAEVEAQQRREAEAAGEGKKKKRRGKKKKKEPELNADGVEICRSFQSTGSCRFVGDCKWAHEGYVPGADADAKAAAGAGAGAGAGPRRRRKKKKAANVCFAFQEEGECKYGDECRFKHGEHDTRDLTRPVGPCFNFRDNGECQYGDECRFSHEAEAAAV